MSEVKGILESKIKDLESRRESKNINILDTRNSRSVQETELIADKLVETFHSPGYRNVFLRAAWRLSDARLTAIVEKALQAPVPRAYFIKSVKREPSYNA